MAKNPRDLRTEAIVLRRTDYGEADRILQLLTPEGKRSVIAKGVRKEKSKLAGGIELFSVSEVVIHEGRTEMGILTGAKLLEYYDAFVKDIELIEMGGAMMRSVSARAEQVESPEFYKILKQSLRAMQKHAGEEVNLKFDTDGEKLLADGRYYWDEEQAALGKAAAGRIGADHIKMMRLMASGPAELSMKVTGADALIDEVLYIARCMERVTQI